MEAVIVTIALEQPAWGQHRVANELAKQGRTISSAGVRSVWVRHDLATMKQRLEALEAQVAQDGRILTEAQLAALERGQHDTEAHGEFESECPGYCGAQDTFYVGYIKGVGHVYQQTFIDTYAKVGFAKLYTDKTAITAADLLNDRVVPIFDEHSIPLRRVLTDRGSEYCGAPDRASVRALPRGRRHRTYADQSQAASNERHLRAFQQDRTRRVYRVTFRKRLYATLDQLQADLDRFIDDYNTSRPHQGRWCYGKTAMQTFVDSLALAKEKCIA